MIPGMTALTAFDLVCRGTMIAYGADGSSESQRKPSVMSFRVDLVQRRWCDGEECPSTAPLVRVSPTEIWFQDVSDKTWNITSVANRETGRLSYSANIMGVKMTFGGICLKRKFSGFPPQKF